MRGTVRRLELGADDAATIKHTVFFFAKSPEAPSTITMVLSRSSMLLEETRCQPCLSICGSHNSARSFERATEMPQQAIAPKICFQQSHKTPLKLRDSSFRGVAHSSKLCGKILGGLPGIGLNVWLHNCIGHCARAMLNLTVARNLGFESRDGSTASIYPGASVLVSKCSWRCLEKFSTSVESLVGLAGSLLFV